MRILMRELFGDQHGVGCADGAWDDADFFPFHRSDPQLGVMTGPTVMEAGVVRRAEVTNDVAIGVEDAHCGNALVGAAALAPSFAQEVLDLEHRRLVVGLPAEDRGNVSNHFPSLRRMLWVTFSTSTSPTPKPHAQSVQPVVTTTPPAGVVQVPNTAWP